MHRSRPINWRQEYLHLAVALMTACWLSGWIALSLNWFIDISLSTVLGMGVLHLLLSMVIVRWAHHRRINGTLLTSTSLLMMWMAAGITLLAMPWLARAYKGTTDLAFSDLFYFDKFERAPAGPIIILWVLFLWWRGYQFGYAYMTLTRAAFGLRLGILSFLIISIVAGKELRGDILSIVPFFFFFGLLGSSLARADSLNLDRAQRSTTFGRGWIISLVSLTLVVTLVSYGASLWLSGTDYSQFLIMLGTLGEGVLTLLFLVFSPILLLAQAAYNFLSAVMPDKLSTIIPSTGSGSSNNPNNAYAPWLADLLSLASNVFLGLIVVLLIVLVLTFIWFLFVARPQNQESDAEERESLGTTEMVGGLRQALRDSWRRLADALGILRQFGMGRDFFTALTIRRIYARMEKLASKRGYPRSAAETPYEYRCALTEAFPGQDVDIQSITEAYIAVRYGDVPENPGDLQAVVTAWEHLQNSPDQNG